MTRGAPFRRRLAGGGAGAGRRRGAAAARAAGGGRAKGAPVALGLDLPLGLPRDYARHLAEPDFPAFLRGLAARPDFFAVSATLETVGRDRPFYPARGAPGHDAGGARGGARDGRAARPVALVRPRDGGAPGRGAAVLDARRQPVGQGGHRGLAGLAAAGARRGPARGALALRGRAARAAGAGPGGAGRGLSGRGAAAMRAAPPRQQAGAGAAARAGPGAARGDGGAARAPLPRPGGRQSPTASAPTRRARTASTPWSACSAWSACWTARGRTSCRTIPGCGAGKAGCWGRRRCRARASARSGRRCADGGGPCTGNSRRPANCILS